MMYKGLFNPLFFAQNVWWVAPLIFLDLFLRGMALWKSAKANKQYWFIALLLVNSMGILPAFYLYFVDGKSAKKGK